MSEFGCRQAFGWRYISYWGYIRLNVDIPSNKAGKIVLKKGDYTMAIIAEDINKNLKAKVLNPYDLFDSSFVMLSKPAAQSDGEGDFDHMSDVPITANYEMAKKEYDDTIEQDKWDNGEYDDFMFEEREGLIH